MNAPISYIEYFNEFATRAGPFVAAIFIAIALSVIASTLKLVYADRFSGRLPISHKIAVLGLPKSGKTTLITAIFELIQRGDFAPDARLHGIKTIKNVNQNIARLNSGVQIAPTLESDTFIFRFSYVRKRLFFKFLYDVEIADFPGEYSQKISFNNDDSIDDNIIGDDFDYTLFNKEFFSWIASSREYVFLIDLAAIYSSPNAVSAIADISGRVRTSWQVIEDAISERGIGSAKNRRVRLVFSKFDSLSSLFSGEVTLLQFSNTKSNELKTKSGITIEKSIIQDDIKSSGEKTDLRFLALSEVDEFGSLMAQNNHNFDDLISFFVIRTQSVKIIYSSMVLKDEKNKRLGVKDILISSLP